MNFAGNFAVAVYDIGFGNHCRAIGEGDGGATVFGARVRGNWGRYGLVDDELGEGVGILVGGYAED